MRGYGGRARCPPAGLRLIPGLPPLFLPLALLEIDIGPGLMLLLLDFKSQKSISLSPNCVAYGTGYGGPRRVRMAGGLLLSGLYGVW